MYCAVVLYVQTRKGDNMDLLQMGAQMLAQQLGGNTNGDTLQNVLNGLIGDGDSLLDSLGGIDGMANLAKGFFR